MTLDVMRHIQSSRKDVAVAATVKKKGGIGKLGIETTPKKERTKKVIYYLHIHKSGGSTMCKQASFQRLKVNSKSNCNVQADQRCCGYKDSYQAQAHFADHTFYDFVASEKEMYDAMAPDYYDYVVTLRDSATRYMSHWNHVRTLAKLNPRFKNKIVSPKAKKGVRKLRIPKQKPPPRAKNMRTAPTPSPQPKPQTEIKINEVNEKYVIRNKDEGSFYVGNFTAWWELQPDNYSTRMICGAKCLNTPKFQLTPDLFRITLERLSLFSHILFVEDMEASYDKFSSTVGWDRAKQLRHENQRIDSREKKTVAELMADNNLSYDPFTTVLDDALYGFARQRYESNYANDDTAIDEILNSKPVREYFEGGKKRGCKNPCCGKCSAYR